MRSLLSIAAGSLPSTLTIFPIRQTAITPADEKAKAYPPTLQARSSAAANWPTVAVVATMGIPEEPVAAILERAAPVVNDRVNRPSIVMHNIPVSAEPVLRPTV